MIAEIVGNIISAIADLISPIGEPIASFLTRDRDEDSRGERRQGAMGVALAIAVECTKLAVFVATSLACLQLLGLIICGIWLKWFSIFDLTASIILTCIVIGMLVSILWMLRLALYPASAARSVFPIAFRMISMDDDDRSAFLDEFRAMIEAAQLQFGGGGHTEDWSGWVEPGKLNSISAERRQNVIDWIEAQALITSHFVGPLKPRAEWDAQTKDDDDYPQSQLAMSSLNGGGAADDSD
ncbi:MAG: 50S ribosome-binding protein YggL [Planctomycetota bacterium]